MELFERSPLLRVVLLLNASFHVFGRLVGAGESRGWRFSGTVPSVREGSFMKNDGLSIREPVANMGLGVALFGVAFVKACL